MKKSISTRIRITKRGKILRRSMALDHFRTRKTKKNLRVKSKYRSLDYPMRKLLTGS